MRKGVCYGIVLSVAVFAAATGHTQPLNPLGTEGDDFTCAVQTAQRTWTGDSGTPDWANPDNWEPSGIPNINDRITIPSYPYSAVYPSIEISEAVCSGLILQPYAHITIQPGAGLYVIQDGDADFDGDGICDVAEAKANAIDIDKDGRPNFDDPDSDNDGMPDRWEFKFHVKPYDYGDPMDDWYPFADPDHDGMNNLTEAMHDTDPFSPDPVLPAASPYTRALAIAIIALAAALLLRVRKPGKRWLLLLALIIGITLLVYQVRADSNATITVDLAAANFDFQQTVRMANPGDTLQMQTTARSWYGRSIYINKSLTLRADHYPVFFGAMKTTVSVALSGQGSVRIESMYQDEHPWNTTVSYGAQNHTCFLGELMFLRPTARSGWRFSHWNGANNISAEGAYMVATENPVTIAVFGPPGVDLAISSLFIEQDSVTAGDEITGSLRVMNIGHTQTSANEWSDGIYLSRDSVWDPKDLLLNAYQHDGSLPSGNSYTLTFQITAPDVGAGAYYILGVADTAFEVETNRENNSASNPLPVLDANLSR